MPEPTIDSSQLVELDALLRTRSVSAAARALGKSESGVRAALEKLRSDLRDRLLVGRGAGAKLTPRGRALAGPVAEAMARWKSAAQRDISATAVLQVAATDYVQLAAGSALAQAVRTIGPGHALSLQPIEQRALLQRLAGGRTDLALGLFDAIETEPAFRRKLLFRDRFVCVMRSGHPAARRWDLDQYAGVGHVSVSPGGDVRARGVVDEALARHGRTRSVAVALPSLWAAGEVAATSDCVLTVPERVGRAFAARGAVVLLAPPVTLPALSVYALWHDGAPRAAEVKRVVSTLAGALGESAARGRKSGR